MISIEETIRQIIREELLRFKSDMLKDFSKQNALSEFCTEAELMEKLNHPHPSSVWRWRKNGQLPEPITIGNEKLYRISELAKNAKPVE